MRLRTPLRHAGISMDNKVISSVLLMSRETIARETFFVSFLMDRVFILALLHNSNTMMMIFVVSLKKMITEFFFSILTQL